MLIAATNRQCGTLRGIPVRNRIGFRLNRIACWAATPRGWSRILIRLFRTSAKSAGWPGAASGFCGIAWNNVGITRFQLPTKSAIAAERTLLRRVPDAERGAPTPEVVEAVAAVKRYFEGEETDFSGFRPARPDF
jgi:hypothetical protein